MKSSSLLSGVRLPRVLLALTAFLVPHLVWAGTFYLPAQPVAAGTNAAITWYGTYGMNPGVYVVMQAQAPGSSTWTTIGSGYTGYYGSCSISAHYVFNTDGVWTLRVGNDTATLEVSGGSAMMLRAGGSTTAGARFEIVRWSSPRGSSVSFASTRSES